MDRTKWFKNSVSTLRLVTTLDSGRKPISTFSENLSSVECLIQQFKGMEPIKGGRKHSEIKHVLYCRYNEDIIMSDLVKFNSENFEIIEQQFEGNGNSYMKLLLAKSER